MDHNKSNPKRALGAQAVAAALAITSPFLYAEQANSSDVEKACADKNDVKCEINQTEEAMEKIRVHGVRSSVYLSDESGDVRRIAALVDYCSNTRPNFRSG